VRACRVTIKNFRGVKSAVLVLPKHGVLIGDNNTGKTTILEALDLTLGPDRLNRQPPIDEHDFYGGAYLRVPAAPPADAAEAAGDGEAVPPAEEPAEEPSKIEIEVTVADLTEEQKGRFGDYSEFWDGATDTFYDEPNPAGVDGAAITEALRVTFLGWYDAEEDDFEGRTYFTRSLIEGDRPEPFSRRHKQVCGFLYLRSLRTGSRALSLERGSLLDIILRLKEVRPQMWEATLSTLADISVASDPQLGISPVLESINTALKKYVPKEWGVEPHLKVSNLTREHLRKVITAFIATGDGDHAAPFYRQGTGTINMLVLAMLSQIAQDKQNVIFCHGGAGNGDPAIRAEAYCPRGAEARIPDHLYVPFPLRAGGVRNSGDRRACARRRRDPGADAHHPPGQCETKTLSAAVSPPLLRRASRPPCSCGGRRHRNFSLSRRMPPPSGT
jgi:putative ATP-dependent endonuclease of the OLD family